MLGFLSSYLERTESRLPTPQLGAPGEDSSPLRGTVSFSTEWGEAQCSLHRVFIRSCIHSLNMYLSRATMYQGPDKVWRPR